MEKPKELTPEEIEAREFMSKIINDPKFIKEREERFGPFKRVTQEDLDFVVD